MKARQFKKLFKNVSMITLNKSDIVAIQLKSAKRVTVKEITYIHKALEELFPNNKVMILRDDMDVKIIREE